MVECHSPAKEGHCTISLVEDGTKTSVGCITIDDELLGEVGQLEHRCQH